MRLVLSRDKTTYERNFATLFEDARCARYALLWSEPFRFLMFFSFTRKMPFLGSPSDIGSERERERVKFDQIRRLLDYVHGRSLKICSNFRMLSDWLVPFERGISLSEECYNLAFTQQYKNKDRSLHRLKGVVIKIPVTLIFGQVFAAHHSDLLTTWQFPDQI